MAKNDPPKDSFKDIQSAAIDAVNIISKSIQNGGVSGVTTGFEGIDHKLGGLQKSDLIVLSGRPSMGKTSLATNIALNAALEYKNIRVKGKKHKNNKGAVVGFFTLELSNDALANKVLALHSQLSPYDMRTGKITQEGFNKVSKTFVKIADLPFFIDDSHSITIEELKKRARLLYKEEKMGLLIVDYLQLISASASNDNTSFNGRAPIYKITRELKSLAKELQIPVLVLSQLDHKLENRNDQRPSLSDLSEAGRESGSIEQDADIVAFIYRPDYYHNQQEPDPGTAEHMKWLDEASWLRGKAEFIIAKRRHGPTGIVELQFEAEITKFSDRPISPEYHAEKH